jgi:hypothetical protein
VKKVLVLTLCLLGVALAPACKRNDTPPEPLPVEQFASTLQQTFSKGPPGPSGVSTELAKAVEAKNYPLAFGLAQDLCASTELTEDQQLIATRAMLTVSSLLQQAQASGDKASAEVLQMHRRSR